MDKLLTVGEVAQSLGVKKSTVYAWVSQGYIDHYKLGGLVKFSDKMIESWLERKKVAGKKSRAQKTPLTRGLK